MIDRSPKNKLFVFAGLCLILLCSSAHSFGQKQKSFTGMLEYRVTPEDTSLNSLYPETSMIVYTNDTIVRMENYTSSFGKQVTIRHIEKNKSYQLLETDFGKYAIQVDLNQKDTVPTEARYTFDKTCGKKKILGKKAKAIEVMSEGYTEPKTFYYYKDIENKYINTFPEIPGLVTEYYVTTYDVILKYELVRINEYTPDRDLFGIPSDYKRVSIDEFMDIYLEYKSKGEITDPKIED